jgi:hypothetical protein
MTGLPITGRATPLRRYLKDNNMPQRALARRVGLSNVAIHYMLREDRSIWVVEHRGDISLYEWKHIAGGAR